MLCSSDPRPWKQAALQSACDFTPMSGMWPLNQLAAALPSLAPPAAADWPLCPSTQASAPPRMCAWAIVQPRASKGPCRGDQQRSRGSPYAPYTYSSAAPLGLVAAEARVRLRGTRVPSWDSACCTVLAAGCHAAACGSGGCWGGLGSTQLRSQDTGPASASLAGPAAAATLSARLPPEAWAGGMSPEASSPGGTPVGPGVLAR